jgi:hypothetical protein
MALPSTLKKYLKAKEELWKLNSNISPCKNIPNLPKKSTLKETKKILQDIITLKLISSFNTSQSIMFQKFSYKNGPIIYYLVGAKIHEASNTQ